MYLLQPLTLPLAHGRGLMTSGSSMLKLNLQTAVLRLTLLLLCLYRGCLALRRLEIFDCQMVSRAGIHKLGV